MIFTETTLKGVLVIEPECITDERGFFARTWSTDEFKEHGLNPCIAHCSLSFNRRKGTLRGLHMQKAPHQEAKLVRCTMGAIFDVALDLRPGSSTYLKWTSVELSSANRKMLYIPEGCAHGFQTLTDDSEVFYQISETYHPESAAGVRWNDPHFRIAWPLCDNRVMNERDATYPEYIP